MRIPQIPDLFWCVLNGSTSKINFEKKCSCWKQERHDKNGHKMPCKHLVLQAFYLNIKKWYHTVPQNGKNHKIKLKQESLFFFLKSAILVKVKKSKSEKMKVEMKIPGFYNSYRYESNAPLQVVVCVWYLWPSIHWARTKHLRHVRYQQFKKAK